MTTIEEPGALNDDDLRRRRRLVEKAVKDWVDQLIDLSARNNLLYFRDLKQGTLDLGRADPVALEGLLGSRTVRSSNLSAETNLLSGSKRARTIRAKATENFEERGIQTLYLAWGMANWENRETAATPAAPVLLRQANLVPQGNQGEDFDLSLPGEWEINPTLVHLLRAAYDVSLDSEALAELLRDDDVEAPDPLPVFSELERAAKAVPGSSEFTTPGDQRCPPWRGCAGTRPGLDN